MIQTFVRGKGIHQTKEYLESLRVELPRALQKDSRKIMTGFKTGLRHSALAKGLRWKGQLTGKAGKGGIYYRKTGEGQYSLFVPEYGAYLDDKNPQRVYLSTSNPRTYPSLRRWFKSQLGVDTTQTPVAVTLRKHPWISDGLKRGEKILMKRIREGEIGKTIRRR